MIVNMRLLLIEDEIKLAKAIKRGLENEGYAVDIENDGLSGKLAAESIDYDLLIVDWMLPKTNGVDLIKELRKDGYAKPALMLTARDSVRDKINGLDSGADDYLVKPFNFEELLARIRALLRRPSKTEPPIISTASLQLNPASQTVTRDGVEIELSSKEFSLLSYLLRNKGQVKSKAMIIEHVWNFDANVLENTVEAFIASLRKKIEKPFPDLPPVIHTIRGTGYKAEEKNV